MKKTMQKLNYLMVKSLNDLNGSQEHHSQTPVELIIPQNIRSKYLDYKIWIHHEDETIMSKLEEIFSDKEAIYYKSLGACLGLGTAFNLGWMESDCIYDGNEENIVSKEFISSSIPVEKVKELRIESMKNNETKLIKEELPLEFDQDRCITDRGLKDILVNISGGYIPAVVNSFVKLDSGENIVWME
jgi:CRISPR-associated protein Cas5h